MRRFDTITAWLGGLPVWKFVVVVFLAATMLPMIVMLLPESWSGEGPNVELTTFDFILACGVIPLFETFVFQFLVVWLMTKWVTKNIMVQVIVSAVLFGSQHCYNISYVLFAFLMGIVLAWGFCAYYHLYGFRRAFWSVALVHMLRNTLSFTILLLEEKL